MSSALAPEGAREVLDLPSEKQKAVLQKVVRDVEYDEQHNSLEHGEVALSISRAATTSLPVYLSDVIRIQHHRENTSSIFDQEESLMVTRSQQVREKIPNSSQPTRTHTRLH